jgi:hypothetical protein
VRHRKIVKTYLDVYEYLFDEACGLLLSFLDFVDFGGAARNDLRQASMLSQKSRAPPTITKLLITAVVGSHVREHYPV